MEQRDLGTIFLVNFIQDIIEIKAPIRITEIKQENINLIQKPISNKMIQPINELSKFKTLDIKIPKDKFIKKEMIISTVPKSIIHYESNQIYSNLKLSNLLKDPYIDEIECLNIDSPLMVKKSGLSQKTQVKPSIEEIYEIIAEFSQKSRIPVINGRIKAALNNWIITATLSENFGPKFIIQRRKY